MGAVTAELTVTDQDPTSAALPTPGNPLGLSAGDLFIPPTMLDEVENWQRSEVLAEGDAVAAKPRWELKQLKPLHKNVASLIAQGMKNVVVAQLCEVTPEYVSMLLRQPLVKAHIAEICEVAGVKMEALFDKTVDVISDAMENGSRSEQLKAARLQLEATSRIGKPDPSRGLSPVQEDRLAVLAERLIALQTNARKGRLFDETGAEIQEA